MLHEERRHGNQEEEEEKWKERNAKRLRTVQKEEAPDPADHNRKRLQGEDIRFVQARSRKASSPIEQETRKDDRDPVKNGKSFVLPNLFPFRIEKVAGDERDENNVGVIFGMIRVEGILHKPDQRTGENDRENPRIQRQNAVSEKREKAFVPDLK
jgi:hypothetical protein